MKNTIEQAISTAESPTKEGDEKCILHFEGTSPDVGVIVQTTSEPPITARQKRKKSPREYQKHGLVAARKALASFGSRSIDGRTVVGRALQEWRAAIEDDLGGRDNMTAAEACLLDVAARSHLLLSSLDAWLLGQKRLVSLRNRSAIPALVQRGSLAATLITTLDKLGTKRRKPQALSLGQYLEVRAKTVTSSPDAPAAVPEAFPGIPVAPDLAPDAVQGEPGSGQGDRS